MGRGRESEVMICLECTAGWSPQTGQSFLKSKLCLRRKQNKWVGGVECYSEYPWNFLGRSTKWNHLWLGWGEWELVLERSQGFRGKLVLQMLTPQFPLPDCVPLKGQKSIWLTLFPMIPNRVLGENGMCGLIMSQQCSLLSLKIGME